jgi:pyruvate/2-oxoglutarate dehydrogenase complex dihydrolipoamide acyltransferase (E2) component
VNCLDGETLAAWFDGGLSGAALEDVRSHVAGCARCQALVGAMGRTRAAVPAPDPERSSRWWLAWAVPAAAAATAVAIWVLVPQPTNVAVTRSAPSSLQKQEAQPQTPPPAAAAAAPAESAAPPARAAAPALQDRARNAAEAQTGATRELKSDVAQQAPDNVVESVPIVPAASAERREDTARQDAAAPQLQTRAAFGANPCGPMWPAPPSNAAGQITGGSAPSDAVCWIIGRAGTVFRSTDHQTWQRVNFPESVDLSSINATDPRSATVVTVDGRTFSTTDGGVTWTQR